MSRLNFARLTVAFAVLLLALPNVSFAGAPPSGGGVIFDFDDDGKSDLLLNKTQAPNIGLQQTQLIDGITKVGGDFVTILDGYQPIGAGDFGGTGQSDIIARKTVAPNQGLIRILTLNATGTAVMSSVFPAIVDPAYSLIGIGDLDDNGTDDLAFVKTTAPNQGLVRVYLFATNRTVMSTGFPGFVGTDFVGVGLVDINGSGRADIVVQKTGAPNMGLVRALLTAAGGLTVSSSTFPMITPSGYELVAAARFNADDQADFLLEKVLAPSVGLMRVQFVSAGGTGISGNSFPAVLPSPFETVAIGDYDGLNQTDFTARNLLTGVIRIYILNADATGIGLTGFPSAPSTAYAVVKTGPVFPLP